MYSYDLIHINVFILHIVVSKAATYFCVALFI